MILEFKGKAPEIHESSYVAPNSTLIGNLTVGEKCMVLFGAVVRADMNSISIGPKCCIQENAVVHAANDKIVFEQYLAKYLNFTLNPCSFIHP